MRLIGADSLKNMLPWRDLSYTVQPDMKIHTGGEMSLGRGLIHCRSSEQKLNMKISTEAEVVELSDYVPFNITLCQFMEAHGYPLKSNVV